MEIIYNTHHHHVKHEYLFMWELTRSYIICLTLLIVIIATVHLIKAIFLLLLIDQVLSSCSYYKLMDHLTKRSCVCPFPGDGGGNRTLPSYPQSPSSSSFDTSAVQQAAERKVCEGEWGVGGE